MSSCYDRYQTAKLKDALFACMQVPTSWRAELNKMLFQMNLIMVTIKANTEKGNLQWIMARDDIRERITSWLDKAEQTAKESSKNRAKAKQYKDEGNTFFKNHNYAASVESYTQSARYATFEKNDFSVAIANRSAAFCHLGRYKESLQDIKLAIDCGYPAASLWKLHLRAVECHVALDDNKSAQEEMDKLSEWFDRNAEPTSSPKTTILKRAEDLMAGEAKGSVGMAKRSIPQPTLNPETMLPKNEEFPFASPSVILKTCPKRGKRVVAVKNIKKGELLFVEKPFAWIPMTLEDDAKLCAHCCGPLDDYKIPCRGCLEASYCGRACWENSRPYHQWECASYQMKIWQRWTSSHLAFRTLIVSTTNSDIRRFNDVHKLRTHFDKISPAVKLPHVLTSLMVVIYLEKCTNFFQAVDIKEAFVDKFEDESLSLSDIDLSTIEGKKLYVGTIFLRHSLQMVINAYAILRIDDSCPGISPESACLLTEDRHLGKGAYPSTSMLRHSCDPTAVQTFWKNWLIVKSLKDVAPGQEIFTCYGPHYRQMAKSERMNILQEQYHLICECKICTDPRFDFYTERFRGLKCPQCSGSSQLLKETNAQRCFDCRATSPFNSRDALARASTLFKEATEILNSSDPGPEVLSALKKCLVIRKKYLWKYNEDLMMTFCSLGRAHELSEDWLSAVAYAEQGLLCIQEQFGPESMEVAVQLDHMTHVIIHFLEETPDRRTDFYRRILKKGQEHVIRMEKIINLVAGPWCKIYRAVKEKHERFYQIEQSLHGRGNSSAFRKPRNR